MPGIHQEAAKRVTELAFGVSPEQPFGVDGKLSKERSFYKEKARIPLYGCNFCRFFVTSEKKCRLVTEGGVPTPGTIEPGATCYLWNDNGPRRLIAKNAPIQFLDRIQRILPDEFSSEIKATQATTTPEFQQAGPNKGVYETDLMVIKPI